MGNEATQKGIYSDEFPAGHYKMKVFGDRPVAWSAGFSLACVPDHLKRKVGGLCN